MHLAKPIDPGELVASVATLARRITTETYRSAERESGRKNRRRPKAASNP